MKAHRLETNHSFIEEHRRPPQKPFNHNSLSLFNNINTLDNSSAYNYNLELRETSVRIVGSELVQLLADTDTQPPK